MSTEQAQRRFTVDEYLTMAEAGIFRDGPRVELIEGEILEMSPEGLDHSSLGIRWNFLLPARLAGRALATMNSSIRLALRTMPEPDYLVLRPSQDFYKSKGAGPGDILLVAEFSHTSLRHDRNVKARLYAEAGLPEYWLVDIPAHAMDVYRAPVEGRYTSMARYLPGQRIALLAFPDVELTLDELLG